MGKPEFKACDWQTNTSKPLGVVQLNSKITECRKKKSKNLSLHANSPLPLILDPATTANTVDHQSTELTTIFCQNAEPSLIKSILHHMATTILHYFISMTKPDVLMNEIYTDLISVLHYIQEKFTYKT